MIDSLPLVDSLCTDSHSSEWQTCFSDYEGIMDAAKDGSSQIHTNNFRIQLLIKRALDLALSGALILFTSPLLTLISMAVLLDGEGSVLYVSERVGLRGRIFSCYKFRTMVPGADGLLSTLAHLNEREGILFKITHDPRVTRVGRVLRKYSLDELPQLWNVLRGDMSLVGPRPPISSEVAQYKAEQFRRLEVTPGITGLWQVVARRDPSFESYIELDHRYVTDWSIMLDLKILLRTVGVVLNGTGS